MNTLEGKVQEQRLFFVVIADYLRRSVRKQWLQNNEWMLLKYYYIILKHFKNATHDLLPISSRRPNSSSHW